MKEKELFAFVVMPFLPEFDDIYKFGIKEPAAELGIIAERVDEQIYTEGILERIYRQIEVADIIIADMSAMNSNVFYEVGYAHGKEKLCILLTKDAKDIPFDLKHKRHIVYNGAIKELKQSLLKELEWAKNEIENVSKSQIKVDVKKIYGNLEKTKYIATAEVDFQIDLLNDTNKTSAEIEAIYFYSGNGWALYQDGKECSSTSADIPDFPLRHFITPPLKKLHKNSWAQLKFMGKKKVGNAFKGEELKDTYKISGRAILRLVTSEGHFDYELSIDTMAEYIPF